MEMERRRIHLAVGGTVLLDDPTGLVADGLEDLVVVAVLGELVVSVRPKPGVDLGGDRPPPPLPPLVVLPLLPGWEPAPSGSHSTQLLLLLLLRCSQVRRRALLERD